MESPYKDSWPDCVCVCVCFTDTQKQYTNINK